jgi:hypothetical protein
MILFRTLKLFWTAHLAALNEVIVHKIVIIGLEGSPEFVLVLITVTP